jgi:hypothetical protein
MQSAYCRESTLTRPLLLRHPEYDLLISDDDNLTNVEAPLQIFVGVIPSDLQSLIEPAEDVASVVTGTVQPHCCGMYR